MESIAEVAEGKPESVRRQKGGDTNTQRKDIVRIPTSQIVDDATDLLNHIPLKKEDLIWASLDADKDDKFYKKPPPLVPSAKIYREYLYSLGEVPFGEKKRKVSTLSPLLPKNLEDLSVRQRAEVCRGASQRQFSPLKLKTQKRKYMECNFTQK